MLNRLLNDLPRRAVLTVRVHGWGTLLVRFLTAPLRPFGLERGLRERLRLRAELRDKRRWYRAEGRPVTVIVPTFGPPDITFEAVRKLRRTTDASRTRIVVVDDGSPPEHQQRLRSLDGVQLVLSPENAGYSASVNRGLEQAGPEDDVVVLNNDVMAHRHWLPQLQHAAYDSHDTGVVGPRLLYPDGRIQSAGSYRNLEAPEWFDHRYRFRPADFGPAQVPAGAIAVTGACMYLRRDLIEALGGFDESYPMGYEDVDYCLRAWEAGRPVRYEPSATLTHLESPTRGTEVGDRERRSQSRFWERWESWFEDRPVRTADGALRIDLRDRGDRGGRRPPRHLRAPEPPEGEGALGGPLLARGAPRSGSRSRLPCRASRASTSWPRRWRRRTRSRSRPGGARATRSGGARCGAAGPCTSSRTSRPRTTRGATTRSVNERRRVLASYRQEFRYMTISRWNRDRLREFGLDAELVPPGIDLDTFRPLDVERRTDMMLAIGRANQLKNFPLTAAAWQRLDPRPELCLFGVEPEVGGAAGGALRVQPERRRRERAVQRGRRVRPDLASRGLLPAPARGDGGGGAGGVHRRPRQPRLLPRRGELPDGGGPIPPPWRPGSAVCWATRRCGSGSWRAASRRWGNTPGIGASTSSRSS